MSVPLSVTSSEAVFPEQRRGQSCGLQSGPYLEWTLEKLAKSKWELKTASEVGMELSLEKVPSSRLGRALPEQPGRGEHMWSVTPGARARRMGTGE